jgi:hypothetical protein
MDLAISSHFSNLSITTIKLSLMLDFGFPFPHPWSPRRKGRLLTRNQLACQRYLVKVPWLAVLSLKSPSSTAHMARHMAHKTIMTDHHDRVVAISDSPPFGCMEIDSDGAHPSQASRLSSLPIASKPLTSLDQIWRPLRRPFSRPSRLDAILLEFLAFLPFFVAYAFAEHSTLRLFP